MGRLTNLSVFLLGLICCLPRFTEAKTLDVAVALRFGDKFNSTVTALYRGIETAKSEFETKNQGVKIRLTKFSHGTTLESVTREAKKISDQGFKAVIGGEWSSESFVLSDYFEPKHIVFVTPTSSHPDVTKGKPYTFRSCFSDDKVAEKLASYVAEKLKPKSVGMIHNVSEPYTDFLSTRFLEVFSKIAPSVPIHREKILRKQTNFEKQVKAFIDRKVTHVVMLTYDSDLVRFFVEAARQNFFPVYIGSDGWGSNEFVYKTMVTDNSRGDRFVGFRNMYWNGPNTNARSSFFAKQYKRLFQEPPNSLSAIGYDSAWILFSAMYAAKNPKDGAAIRDAMKSLSDLQLVTTDQFRFDQSNTPEKDLHIFRIDSKNIYPMETL